MALNDLHGLLTAFEAREVADPEAYPASNVAELHAAGILKAPFPVSLGGEAVTLLDAVRAIEAIAGVSPSTALVASMPLGLAGGVFGTPIELAPETWRLAWRNQVAAAAAGYAAGELYAACNSERGAGGSLAATKTVSRRASDGTFLLSGEKILASCGKYARHFFSTAKVAAEELPGAGVVELFLMRTDAQGVEILDDWNGFGMRSTESQTVRYSDAASEGVLGFPNFIEVVQPLQYFFCLFAAIPLGCVATMLQTMGTPAPGSAALRLRLAEATMRYEALRAYLHETATQWRPAAGPAYGARVLRTKTFVTEESAQLCASLFALGGGRHYRRDGRGARVLADVFAGTALRPPLALGLETLSETFELPGQ
jgi:isovaleryl-CoA dehydrogenase